MTKSKPITLASDNLNAITLRLAMISGAVQAAGNIVISHANADDQLQQASDILDLAVLEINRLRDNLTNDSTSSVANCL